MGDQPVAHDKSGHRGLQPISRRVDEGPIRKPRKEVPTASREGLKTQAPPRDAEVSREQILPAPDRFVCLLSFI